MPLHPTDRAVDTANAQRQQAADDKAARFHATFAGTATPDQAKRTLADIMSLCLESECPAHASQFDSRRMFHITGRQAIAREIREILRNQPPNLHPTQK